ncbi:MAG: hypothetical protein RBS88_01855 [Spongiibacteraceae bacterium]|jgi:hypothetical protein|nr:hypothetical protein [Spongiibacteraceae bacterium]
MADLHIDDFFKDAGLILLQLYNGFPRRQLLYVEDIIGPTEVDEFGLPDARHQACFSTMLWLAEEGWLRYDSTIRQEALDQAVLTRKSLLLLSGVDQRAAALPASGTAPASLTNAARTRVTALRRALKDGNTIAISATVRALLSAGTPEPHTGPDVTAEL